MTTVNVSSLTNTVVVTENGSTTVVSVPSTSVVEAVTVGPQGPQGASGDKERRHDWVSPYDYCGTAPLGSSESASVWRVTRLTINALGDVTATGVATNVTWTGRATHTYT
jgi:hypothetical protein